jgi:hypothetical protein
MAKGYLRRLPQFTHYGFGLCGNQYRHCHTKEKCREPGRIHMDQEEFEGNLQKLRDAAKSSIVESMLDRTKGIIDNCVRYHREFK